MGRASRTPYVQRWREFNASAEQPVNATIAYDPDQGAFAVQPESAGTALDADQIVRKADEALAVLNPKVTLTAEDLLKPTVLSTDAALATATANANTMIAAESFDRLTMP